MIGKIQENMLRIDLSQIQSAGDTFFSPTDMGYLIFMIIGIVGYFTVPSVAGHIMHVGGIDSHSSKMTAIAGGAVGGAVSGVLSKMGSGARSISGSAGRPGNDYSANDGSKNSGNYMMDKIKGD
ncbi:hypothetical protein [Arachidicoccus soli]|uniref:hypothetical protein n=1 Tax=Arachidicoccus soli TaxID=2341117 RepID=UPI001F089846|nr:hypothetical protein [Arachidicoccus soli]